jgi:class 3 adenylate cyclase
VALPETRYAANNGLYVAYQQAGDGPVDIVMLTQWFSNVDSQWDVPPLMAMVFAATYPARVRALVMVNAYPRFTQGDDYPWGFDDRQLDAISDRTRRMWGKGMLLRLFAPSLLADAKLVELESRYERQAASPGTAIAMTQMINFIDVRSVLPAITVPTMLISRADAVPAGHRRYVADHIPGARYVELAGEDQLMWAGDQDALVGEIQEFVTGVRPMAEPDRVLATILFTDIVGSTRLAVEHGDRGWRDLLERHHALVRGELARFRGREVDTAGDGFLAVFDGPGRAVRCASAAVRGVQSLGIEIRAGLHTGEVEVAGDAVRGIAVHIGARVSALAGASEVLVSSTVRDLVAGSGLQFEDRGSHELKGVPGQWRILAVLDA